MQRPAPSHISTHREDEQRLQPQEEMGSTYAFLIVPKNPPAAAELLSSENAVPVSSYYKLQVILLTLLAAHTPQTVILTLPEERQPQIDADEVSQETRE